MRTGHEVESPHFSTPNASRSLRKAINGYCRWCAYDPADRGSAAQQIAACQMTDCPLHHVRPITCKSLPIKLLQHWHIDPASLDDRSRALISQETADAGLSEEEGAESVVGEG